MSDKDTNKIKRGRTASDLPPAQAMSEKGLTAGSRDETAHSSGRPKRISMTNMKKLDISSDLLEDGYYYRWFKDGDGRVEQAKGAYYDHVTDDQGNNILRNYKGATLYLMRLEQQYRDEDNRLKKKRVAATLEAEAAIAPGEYAPDQKTGKAEGGTSAISSENSDNPYS